MSKAFTVTEGVILLAIVAVIAAIIVSSCTGDNVPDEEVRYRIVIPPEKKKEAAAFLSNLVKVANPHSDEEPEDNIIQAERTTLNMFGKSQIGILAGKDGRWYFIPYDECNDRQKRMCDNFMKRE